MWQLIEYEKEKELLLLNIIDSFFKFLDYFVKTNFQVEKRSTSWSLTHNVIYIDNPVGTGFSFTKVTGENGLPN